jgi:myo-inositol 2-dehydrogenase/D-chiro-inositol 1-dehydrogenase
LAKKLGVGVLGVGKMGRRHAETLRRLVPEARLVAVVQMFPRIGPAKVAEELEIVNSFSSIEDLIECKEVDAVLIAVPDTFVETV